MSASSDQVFGNELSGIHLGMTVMFNLGSSTIIGRLEDVRHTSAMPIIDVAVTLVDSRGSTLFELVPSTIVRFV